MEHLMMYLELDTFSDSDLIVYNYNRLLTYM